MRFYDTLTVEKNDFKLLTRTYIKFRVIAIFEDLKVITMEFQDLPATQVCDKIDDLEPTQNIRTSKHINKKQIGVLIVNEIEYPIYTGVTTVGRDDSNNIVLKNTTVSKYHAEIEGLHKIAFVTDLKSCNGTALEKVKLPQNRAYQLGDGNTLSFGTVPAVFRKLESLTDSILKTPAPTRSNKIIASTPDSALNTTDDDSVIYGTQKNEGSSEFRQSSLPSVKQLATNRKNLNNEFLNDESSIKSVSESTSFKEQEMQTSLQLQGDISSGIHDWETQKLCLSKCETSNSSIQKSCEISEAIYEAETQVEPMGFHKVGDSDTDEEGIFQNSDKAESIHEMNTQALSVKSTGPNEISNSNVSKTDNKGFLGFDIKVSTEKMSVNSDKSCESKLNDSESVRNSSIRKSLELISNKVCSRIEDSDTDEEDIFKKPTQEISSALDNIQDERTETLMSEDSGSKKSIQFKKLNESDSKMNDSDVSKDRIFSEPTQKILPKEDKIQETETPDLINKDVAKVDDSNADLKDTLSGPTQKVCSTLDKIQEKGNQQIVTKGEDFTKISIIQNFDLYEERFFTDPTQKYVDILPKKKVSLNENTIIENSDTDSEEAEVKDIKNLESSMEKCSSRSSIFQNANLKDANDSETDDEGIFAESNPNVPSKSVGVKVETTVSKSNSVSKTKIGKKVDSKIAEDLNAEVETVLKNKEKFTDSRNLRQKRFSKRQSQKLQNYLTPSTSKMDDSSTDDENILREKEDSSSRKKIKKKFTKISIQKPKHSPRSSTSKQIEDKCFVKCSLKKSESEEQACEVDDLAPTQIIPALSASNENLCLEGNASIENLDYEMAPTQTLEEFEASKTKTPKTRMNFGKKGSARKCNKRSLNSTVEENLNLLFDGLTNEDVDEPPPMLTQHLKNVLEESQVMSQELLQVPSTSRSKTSHKVEKTPPKESLSLSERNLRSKKSPQVCKFFSKSMPKKSSDFQVISEKNERTCKSSDESDDDFLPYLAKSFDLNSLVNSVNDHSNSIDNLKFLNGNASSSASSEVSFVKSPLNSNPDLLGFKNRKLSLKNKETGIHEEVEMSAMSKNLEQNSDDSDDSDFEELKRIANRVLQSKSAYVQNKSTIELKDSNVSTKKAKVIESNIFQVDADKSSPRMSQLNIIRSKKEPTVTKTEIKEDKSYPLKKRTLKVNEGEPGTSGSGRGKRLKINENEELKISETLFARRSLPLKGISNTDTKLESSLNEVEKNNIKEKRKIVLKNLRVQKESMQPNVSSSSSVDNETVEDSKPKGRGRKTQKKINDEFKINNPGKRRASKRSAVSSSSFLTKDSVVTDSRDVQTSISEGLNIPSKAKKSRNQKTNAVEVGKNMNENVIEASRNRRTVKRQINQNKEIISNTSSSSSRVERSFNEASTSMAEKSIKTEPKKMATRGQKKKIINGKNEKADNSSVSSSILSSSEISAVENSSFSSTLSKSRRCKTSSLRHKVLFTGIDVKSYQQSLQKLGLIVTEDVNNCSVLVTDKVRRTFKFLCATSKGIPIVSTSWLTDSARENNLQDLEQYILKDPDAENKFNFSLIESLKRAESAKMLAGYTVVLTPKITVPPVKELKEMVTTNGGKVLLRPPMKWAENTMIVSNEEDLANAKKFMAKAPKGVKLYSVEFLLSGILKQEVDLQSNLLNIE